MGTGDLIGLKKLHWWVVSGAVAGMLALGLSGAKPAPASTALSSCANAAPCNDNYLYSLEFNSPGMRLNRTDTLKDVRNTGAATAQGDLFAPCEQSACPPGPAETTTCNGASYGKTVWYDFYPDTNGSVLLQTAGFDNVITLYTFNTATLVPNATKCSHSSDFPSEELEANVTKGKAYTVQIGGVNGASGLLEVLFDFYATPPRRLTAQATLTARALPNGIQLLGLTVSTARAAHVAVSCGTHCSPQSKFGNAIESFPRLKGVQMPAGSSLQIRVTAPHSIGALIQYNVLPGFFSKITRCMEPGSTKPRLTCH